MTLNITVATDRCIFQSADFRLTDIGTRLWTDSLATQKIVLISRAQWNATVCFAGVGRTATLDVSVWLRERINLIQPNDPLDRLLDELVGADAWLTGVPHPYNHHSFSVGAFVGNDPVFALVSNFEQPSGLPSKIASHKLSVYQVRPRAPLVFVTGQKNAVTRPERRRLATLAGKFPEREAMSSELARLNRKAASINDFVSSECFTTYLTVAGDGGGRAHGIGKRPFHPASPLPGAVDELFIKLADEQFGSRRWQVRQMALVTANPSDEYHQTQLREKPNDAATHNNLGAFLLNRGADLDGAERAFRAAIQIDAKHVVAITNLARLLYRRERMEEATVLFQRVLEIDPGNEVATLAYADLVLSTGDHNRARDILASGFRAHPNSGRLHLQHAEINLLDRIAPEALIGFQLARERGADPAQTEAGFAIAMHLADKPIGETIGAYRGAISLDEKNANLKLNLAQLLFAMGQTHEAEKLLGEAIRLGLDESAQIEAQFYILCHAKEKTAQTIRAIQSLLARGVRLNWEVKSNIDAAGVANPERARALEKVAEVMKGERNLEVLDDPVVLAAL